MQLRGCLNHAPDSPGWVKRIFLGPGGVRAGWRALAYLALLILQIAILVFATLTILHRCFPHQHFPPKLIPPWMATLNEAFLLPPVLVATAVMAWLEDRPMRSYGLRDAFARRRLIGGLGFGIAALSLLVLALSAGGYGIGTPGTLNASGVLRYGIEWLLVCLLIGFNEEFTSRGYLLQTLTRGAGFWPAAVLTSLFFAAAHGHNPGETYIGLIHVFCAGMLLCLCIYWTKSLFLAIGFHAGWDYSENFIYGTHDSGTACYGTLMDFAPRGNVFLSGGLTGPEGSVLSLAVLVLAAAGLCWFYATRNRRPEQLAGISENP